MEAETGGFQDGEQPRLLLLSRPVWIIRGRHENKQNPKQFGFLFGCLRRETIRQDERSPSRLALSDSSLSVLTPQLGMGGGLNKVDWVELLNATEEKRRFSLTMSTYVSRGCRGTKGEQDPGLSLWLRNGLPLRKFYV